jgi:hypothetical protein
MLNDGTIERGPRSNRSCPVGPIVIDGRQRNRHLEGRRDIGRIIAHRFPLEEEAN